MTMQYDLQPTLRGALVELRPLAAEDWHTLYAVASDPLIWAQHPSSDRYQEAVFREFFRVALETQSAFTVRDVATGAVIGSTRYAGYNPAEREIEIGWTFLARSHWGGRYNSEMKQLMLHHAFRFVDRALFVIGAANTRSRTAIARIGATLLESHPAGGQDHVVYAVHRDASRAS